MLSARTVRSAIITRWTSGREPLSRAASTQASASAQGSESRSAMAWVVASIGPWSWQSTRPRFEVAQALLVGAQQRERALADGEQDAGVHPLTVVADDGGRQARELAELPDAADVESMIVGKQFDYETWPPVNYSVGSIFAELTQGAGGSGSSPRKPSRMSKVLSARRLQVL
jgi:hypothetical protein